MCKDININPSTEPDPNQKLAKKIADCLDVDDLARVLEENGLD